jgi:hypothetical protein
MMRSMLLLSALLAACTVGEAPGKPDGGGTTTGERNTCEPRVATPPAAYNHVGAPTGPRAGMACLDAACHSAGGGSTEFAFAGTVFKDSAGATGAGGVTIRIFKPGDDTPLAEAATDAAGNFIIRNPGDFGAFPYETHVTGCGPNPDIKPMISQISAAEKNCSLGGSCHGAGGGAGVIDLPDP